MSEQASSEAGQGPVVVDRLQLPHSPSSVVANEGPERGVAETVSVTSDQPYVLPESEGESEIDTRDPEQTQPDTESDSKPPTGFDDTQSASENPLRKDTSDSGDQSSKFWSMYLIESRKEDEEFVVNMASDTNGVLVFTGLFGAIVAAFILESYKQLQPDSAGAAVLLLSQISQQLAVAASNSSHFSPLSPAPAIDTFRPSSSAIRVNILWFLSLSLSLLCALAATLMQQWARRYISRTHDAQRTGSPQRQGHIHAYLFKGLQAFSMKSAVETLPAFIHASVVLFFAGLLEFLFPINTTVAYTLLAFLAFSALIYIGLMVLPIAWLNSPFATPLSSVDVTRAIVWLPHILCRALSRISYPKRQTWERCIRHPELTTRWTLCVAHVGFRMSSATIRVTSALERWRDAATRDYILKLEDAAALDDELEADTVQWTMERVIHDDVKLDGFLESAGFLTSAGDQQAIKMVERLARTPGFSGRMGHLLSNATRIEITKPIDHARREQQIESYLRLIRCLLSNPDPVVSTGTLWPTFLLPILTPLVRLRNDTDTDVAVSASCTAAMAVSFLTKLVHRLLADARFSESYRDFSSCLDILVDVKKARMRAFTGWRDQIIYGSNMAQVFNILAFVRGVLLHLKRASSESRDLIWRTLAALDPARVTGLVEGGILVRRETLRYLPGTLRDDIRAAAYQEGHYELAHLVDGEFPAVSSPLSPFTILYDSLRPLYEKAAEIQNDLVKSGFA
ncbi:hypothetical protein BV25DRAFT_599702 [Artomyces pyxidatus]|uniref:Uncharacterized protein n=1 Tax=Artomyces pyxidatus TaxID=48021 RepID=A0ACB8T1T9_9AGAM|nr:hypothetical protein BV25DRAFT_599702 [Artomyces pyxidatus]